MRVQGVPGLGHGAAQHTPEPVAVGVFVLHVGAQRVGVLVDLPADVARPRVCRTHTVEVKARTTCRRNCRQSRAWMNTVNYIPATLL